MVLLKLRKADEGQEWGSLDDSHPKKQQEQEERAEGNKGKSTAELLAQMYAEADEDGRAAISQAWEAGREKREAAQRERSRP